MVEIAAPGEQPNRLGSDTKVYLGLMGYLVAAKIIITYLVPATFRAPAQAAVFAWPWIAGLTAIGLACTWLSRRVGFPGLLDHRVSTRERYLVPIVLGLGLGAFAILVDATTHWTSIAAAKMGIGSIHIPFPASALIYPGGAIIVDVIYYLVPIPVLMWIVSRVFLKGDSPPWLFWSVGVLAAAIEPMTRDGSFPGHPAILVTLFASDYLENLAQVAVFRRAGFLAPVILRVVFYVVWHVLWGLRG